MAFHIQTISNHGTEEPIVARLALQTGELLEHANIPHDQKGMIGKLYVETLTQRLIRCNEAAESVHKGGKDEVDRIEKEAVAFHAMKQKPFIVGLDGHIDRFLSEANACLRDLLQVFSVIHGLDIEDASDFGDLKGTGDSKLAKALEIKLGMDHPLVKGIRADIVWLTELLRKRNANVHPGGLSGTLVIENIVTQPTGGYLPPTWERVGAKGGHDAAATDIVTEMASYVHRLLNLAECILGAIVADTIDSKIFEIYEIPEEARDAAAPVRFRVDISRHLLRTLPK